MSKEILVELNRKRGSVKAQLTRIKDFINNPDEKDKIKLESKMDTLKSLRIKLSYIRNEYYEVVANDSDLEPLELEILDLEHDCEDIQVRIKNIISKIDLKNNDVTSCGNSFNNIKLPDIQLPRFNGSYHDWFNFKEQFISLIDSNNSLTDSQKLYYLKSTLTGIAKDVITIDDSYTSLFECLKKRFENKKLIINSHFSEILSLEKFTHESAKNLRTLIDCCQKH
ncbi:integrase catalytic domain-containing protein [Trichonephila clavata]|uniref:Integrase catalytic domain-containing protein n=1 Tax=Trichonephila clavata TaxID=2740835 RepID=A0A8X6IVT6_TRICU|nr:integrase catalytic domain-containing protein [Trichonephila clavata]